VEQDDPIPELRVLPDATIPARYAGVSGDFNPIHLDPHYARTVAGLPGPILHGLYGMCLLTQANLEAAAGGPRALKALEAEFTDMAYPERELVVRGTVASLSDGGRVHVDCAVEQDGREVLAGHAELDLG
jgi:acyl dehydratase